MSFSHILSAINIFSSTFSIVPIFLPPRCCLCLSHFSLKMLLERIIKVNSLSINSLYASTRKKLYFFHVCFHTFFFKMVFHEIKKAKQMHGKNPPEYNTLTVSIWLTVDMKEAKKKKMRNSFDCFSQTNAWAWQQTNLLSKIAFLFSQWNPTYLTELYLYISIVKSL